MQLWLISRSVRGSARERARSGRPRRLRRLGATGGLAVAVCSLAAIVGPAAVGAYSHNVATRGRSDSGDQRNGGDDRGDRGGQGGIFGDRGFSHRGRHHGPPPQPEGVQVIATGLNQPKKLTVAPDGSLLVALSGDGAPTGTCIRSGEEQRCLNKSGAIDRITPGGRVSTALGGLPSIFGSTGPAEARYHDGALEVLFQDELEPTTHEQPFGPEGALLGDLVRFPHAGAPTIEAAFGPFEAQNNPDNGAGTAVELGGEEPIDSDPFVALGAAPVR